MRRKIINKQKGLTLLELLIIVAIVMVLSWVAVLSYKNYIRSTHYQEIVRVVDTYKIITEKCIKKYKGVSRCNDGYAGIPKSLDRKDSQFIKSITVRKGVITAVPVRFKGVVSSDSYILTPRYGVTSNKIYWRAGGGACRAGFLECDD